MVAFDFGPTADLQATTRDNAQLLINAIFQLPSTSAGEIGGRLAQLPPPSTRLPREKHCPKPRPETRWEKFAREKGILNKKRDRMVWDEDRQDWVPRWGYKSKANDDLSKDKNWVQELKTGQSWDTDELAEKKAAKRQRVAEQKRKEDRNVYEALGTRETKTVPKDKAKLENKAKIHVAGVSDASMGKYSTTKGSGGGSGGVANNRNKRVKVLPSSGAEERSRDLKILDRIISPQPVLNAAKAARMAMHEAQQQVHAERKAAKDGAPKRRSKQGGKKAAKPQRTLRKLRKGSKK
eukprot:TRINITY_DN18981_c0_g1_i1.p1 TRINITY_DN18981_c0_g1~~TRINITY_DN18981_c0_g1_i1.p1  ORF type:complete len:336 (-),score=117.52 TRINITY_DN18981_c0_g1_i1:240-1121(-)